ncbi:hypothetical protein [uncultured Roseobacter sp.]|uniref:hypothetical protein n=1 Tax=uncultured Roseobacter sp. TaxID=114847 RepID=UPI002619F759|nr:hypothetical protein [uncultured Roseobacter sp.]
MNSRSEVYGTAQRAISDLKAAVHFVLTDAENKGQDGLRNVDVGKALGIYMGHVEHVGHISRTLLAMMEAEGVAEQDENGKMWRLKRHPE